MKYILAIDSGATKSNALLFPSENNNESAVVYDIQSFPPINLNQLDFEEAVRRLLLITRESLRISGRNKIVAVSAGISGAGESRIRKKLQKVFSKRSGIDNVRIYPDTETTFAAVFTGDERNCGVLIAGTGSVLYYRNSRGEMKKIGGWGKTIGDEGSGYWIAREALSKICEYYDGREKKSVLQEIAEKKYGLKKDSIVRKIYHENFHIPSIAYDVFRCAEKNDKICVQIITKAAEKLAEHFKPLRGRKIRIALSGSLFMNEILLEKKLRMITSRKYKNIKLLKSRFSPEWGALKLIINSNR